MINYNQIKQLCAEKKIQLNDLAQQTGYTFAGFKRAIELERMSAKGIYDLCRILDITPNEFFDYKKQPTIDDRLTDLEQKLAKLLSK